MHDCLHQKHRMFTYVCFSVSLPAKHQSGTWFCLSTCLQKNLCHPFICSSDAKTTVKDPKFSVAWNALLSIETWVSTHPVKGHRPLLGWSNLRWIHVKAVKFFIPLPESPKFQSMLGLQSVVIYIYILDQAGFHCWWFWERGQTAGMYSGNYSGINNL